MANKIFSINTSRFDPYKSYRFLVYFGGSTTPVAAVSKITGLKRSSDVIEYKEGGYPIILKGLGRTKYEAITLERGVTQDTTFMDWADATQKIDKGSASTSLANLRKEIYIQLLNEAGTAVQATPCIVAGCRSFRHGPTWMRERRPLRWSTSNSRTRAGNATPRLPKSKRPKCRSRGRSPPGWPRPRMELSGSRSAGSWLA